MLDKVFSNLIFCLFLAGGIFLFPTSLDIVYAILMLYVKQYLDSA